MANHALVRDVAIPVEQEREYLAAGFWDASTLVRQLDHWASAAPERVAIVDLDGRRRRTFSELQMDSRRAAGYLASLGVGRGDVVAVQLPNWYETVVLGLGVLRLGAVLNPLVPIYGSKELRLMLQVGQASVIVTPIEYRSSHYAERVAEATRGSGRPIHHIMLAEPGVTATALPECIVAAEPVKVGWYNDASDVSELLFTSGTESLPKGILHTERTTNFGVREWTRFLQLGTDDVVWMPMPIGHSTGFNYGVRLAIYHGLKLVLQDRWNPETAVHLCENEAITCTGVSPTHLVDMLEALRASQASLPRLRYFGCGGAPIPTGLVEAARERGITVLRGYGSTETLCVAKNRPGIAPEKLAGCDGKILPGFEVELRMDTGHLAAEGQEGELFVRGPACCVGFAPVPGVPPRRNTQGWIQTGDLAVIDKDGFITVVGRKKEIIIRGGMNISPREIEELLLKHESIEQASVIALPDQRLGEVVCACLIVHSGAQLTTDDVIQHLKEHSLAPHKLPSRVELFSAFPRTETGKVKKPELVAKVLDRGATPRASPASATRAHLPE